jgi:hypothetical protein
MRVLDLFSGLGGASRAFLDRHHSVITLDIDSRFGCTITENILEVSWQKLAQYGPYDFIWASPPCECFSVASIGHHWTGGIYAYEPKTSDAVIAQLIVMRTLELIDGLHPLAWVMENPRGMLRKLPCVRGLPRVTVAYCQYGENRMKPTDLWGKFPQGWYPRPMCRPKDPCHASAPRGAKTGTQGIKGAAERAVVPYALSLELCLAMEEVMAGTNAHLT